MKLVDVVHEEMFCGELLREKYSCWNNRFELFDKNGRHLNAFGFKPGDKKTIETEVLEIKSSGFQSHKVFVGFPTTHIKLDFVGKEEDFDFINDGLVFGQVNEER